VVLNGYVSFYVVKTPEPCNFVVVGEVLLSGTTVPTTTAVYLVGCPPTERRGALPLALPLLLSICRFSVI
jgi:hypothetical protein